METIEFLNSDSIVTELPDGTTRRVYQYEWPPEKNSKLQKGGSGTSDQSVAGLVGELAALRRELGAARRFMEWQSRRINELELKLNGRSSRSNRGDQGK